MFRVNKAEDGSRTVVNIDGQLSGGHIEVVGTCRDQAVSKGKPVDLFLRDVTTVDQAGRALLRRLAGKGIRLICNGVYTSYLARALNPKGAKTVDASGAGEVARRVS
jgi:hypothetical protein